MIGAAAPTTEDGPGATSRLRRAALRRPSAGLCTQAGLVLRVSRLYISTQTGLLGQAGMADGVDLRCPGLLITVGARARAGTWEAKS